MHIVDSAVGIILPIMYMRQVVYVAHYLCVIVVTTVLPVNNLCYILDW